MRSARERLRRTPDGRYEVGVYIEKDKYAKYVAQVLIGYGYNCDPYTVLAREMEPTYTFEESAIAAREWIKEHITKIYEVKWEDMVVTLLKSLFR